MISCLKVFGTDISPVLEIPLVDQMMLQQILNNSGIGIHHLEHENIVAAFAISAQPVDDITGSTDLEHIGVDELTGLDDVDEIDFDNDIYFHDAYTQQKVMQKMNALSGFIWVRTQVSLTLVKAKHERLQRVVIRGVGRQEVKWQNHRGTQ
jgi:hypothetical protein